MQDACSSKYASELPSMENRKTNAFWPQFFFQGRMPVLRQRSNPREGLRESAQKKLKRSICCSAMSERTFRSVRLYSSDRRIPKKVLA